jgi:hypothetical protein
MKVDQSTLDPSCPDQIPAAGAAIDVKREIDEQLSTRPGLGAAGDRDELVCAHDGALSSQLPEPRIIANTSANVELSKPNRKANRFPEPKAKRGSHRYPEARGGSLKHLPSRLSKCAKAVSRVRFFDMYASD